MTFFYRIILLGYLAVSVSGCALYSEQDYQTLGPPLLRLCNSVEACLQDTNPPAADMPADQFLRHCTAHDPVLLEPLAGLEIRVHRQGNHATLLVCDPQGERALMEDVCCTSKLDKNHVKDKTAPPCEFTLFPQAVCPQQ